MAEKRGSAVRNRVAEVTRATERAVGCSVDQLAALFALESVKGFGPQASKAIYEARLRPEEVLRDPDRLPMAGKRGEMLRTRIAELDQRRRALARMRAERQIAQAAQYGARILSYTSRRYPRNLFESNYPLPVLYVRGNEKVLAERNAVACVGSRKTRQPYDELHRAFCVRAVEEGFTVVSGFALGADTIGHRAALESGGRTILVMPCGLDLPFPPENRALWKEMLAYEGAALVSEYPFATKAASLTLRKRNKLIVALALGVLVTQTAKNGGTMNAYRFALEQRKPVATFEADGRADTSGNKAIGEDEKVGATVFAARDRRAPEWGAWLNRLSSSI